MANRTVSVNLVANIGQYVSGMNAAAGATLRLGESATTSTAKAKSGFDLAGKGALLAGAAVVGGLGMAISKSMEFEKAMSAAAAATTASGAALTDLRDAAMKAGADTQYSATEAAQAITEMGKAGVSTADILGGGLNGALSLAAAGQLDVAKAAEIASVAMTQFKLSGDELPHVADLLAAGAGKAMGSVEDLGMALNQAGLVASSTGISIEETTGTLAAFASAGLVGSDAGTSFRSMLQHLQNPSKESAQKMSELGIAMYDAQGQFVGIEKLAGQLQTQMRDLTPAVRDAAMAQIFGSDAVRAANVLYAQGAKGIAEWTSKVDDQGYAAAQAAKLTDNLAGDLERLGGSFDTLLITIGEGAQGPLRELVQMLGGLLDSVAWAAEAFSSLPGPLQAALLGMVAFVALRGPMTGFLTALQVKAVLAASSLLQIEKGLLGVTLAAAAWGVTKAVGDIIDFTNAGDDAEGMVKNLKNSLSGMEGESRIQATSAAMEQLRGELQEYQKVVDGYDDQGWFNRVIWKNPFDSLNDVKDARESIETIKAAMADLESQGTANFSAIGQSVTGAMDIIVGSVTGVGSAADSTVDQLQQAKDEQEEWLTSLQEISTAFVEPLATYTGLLDAKTTAEREAAEETAAATESTSDSWEDYVGDVSVSLDELATKLEEQLLAQDNWRANIATITQRGGLEVGQILAGMGEEGVQLAAQMANGTDAEFNRMADLLIEDARRGGAGAAAALDTQMKVMAIIGRDGSKATRLAIAQELGIGVGEVQAIADQYGISLATGINPILTALGKRMVGVQRDFKNQRNLWSGGYTGDGGKYEPKGVVHGGEYVLTKEQTSRLGIDQIEAFANSGYAKGGFVTAADVPKPYSTAPYAMPISTAGDATMQKGFDEVTDWMKANATLGGVAGAGAVGGAWGSLWNLVKSQIPQARINSTFRAGDPGYHGRNKAIDFGFGSGPGGAGSAGLASINRLLHDSVGRNLAELIYDGIGDDRPDLKNGKPLTYSAGTRAEHRNHVHAAVYDQGGWLQPGYTMAYNGTGAPERVLTSREFSGSGGGAGGGGMAHAREVRITAVAAPNEQALVRAIVDRQRDLEFLHG